MTMTEPKTTTEWARENGAGFAFSTATDNYEPVPRNVAYGRGWEYGMIDAGRGSGIVLEDVSELKDARDAIYLIDDGLTVRPFYVAAWHPEGTHVILHPFPTVFDDNGDRKVRPDGGLVSFDTWMLGPRRTYHLKVRPTG